MPAQFLPTIDPFSGARLFQRGMGQLSAGLERRRQAQRTARLDEAALQQQDTQNSFQGFQAAMQLAAQLPEPLASQVRQAAMDKLPPSVRVQLPQFSAEQITEARGTEQRGEMEGAAKRAGMISRSQRGGQLRAELPYQIGGAVSRGLGAIGKGLYEATGIPRQQRGMEAYTLAKAKAAGTAAGTPEKPTSTDALTKNQRLSQVRTAMNQLEENIGGGLLGDEEKKDQMKRLKRLRKLYDALVELPPGELAGPQEKPLEEWTDDELADELEANGPRSDEALAEVKRRYGPEAK